MVREARAASGFGRSAGVLAQAEVTHFSSSVRGERVGEPQLHPGPSASTFAASLWDGASGVTPDYFNVGALLPWQNRLGDWSDASGVAQGSAAFSSGGSGSVGPFTMDLTTLARWLQTNSSYGMFLKVAGGAAWVATRAHSDSAQHPVLTVIDTGGVTTVCACAASAVIDPSTSRPVTGEELSLNNGYALLLEFDLDLVPNPIANATLTLTITKSFSTPLSLRAFALRSVKLFEGGIPVSGLAARYMGDAGISADPDVYFATAFDVASLADYFAGAVLEPDSTFAMDPDLGVPALGTKYHVGEFAPFLAIPDHQWSRKWSLGLTHNPANGALIRDDTPNAQYASLGHPRSPSELYFRYYLKLQQGYQCAIEGKKLPGLAGRYGRWVGDDSYGYYNPTAGNGGSPTKGVYTPADGFSGWSLRHHAFAAPADANPFAALVPLNYYAYHAKMADYFGDMWRWGNSAIGYVNLETDRWYCIEHYAKVNDVVGPFDALGNGTAVENGVVRGWLDGVLVFEKTDAVLRKHPAIKVDEVWLDHYHGGTTPAEAEHPFQMAALVVAKSYIGPMPPKKLHRPGPAATLKDLSVNQWFAIPGTELIASTDLSAQVAAGLTNASFQNTGLGDPRRGIMDFSGGSFRGNGSEMLLFGGGGAGAWAGNDVRGLRLESDRPAWRTLVKPAAASAVLRKSVDAATAYMKDGTPNARHSYTHQNFIDATETFMTFLCYFVWQTDSGRYTTVDSVRLSTGIWNPAGTHPDVPENPTFGGSWVCKHPVTEQIYLSTNQKIFKFDYVTNSWQLFTTVSASALDHGAAAIDHDRNIIFRIGQKGSAYNAPGTIDLATGRWTDAAFSGAYASAISVAQYDGPGLVYDPGLGKFLWFQDDGFLYAITYVSPGEYSVDRMTLAGTPPTLLASGVHNGGHVGIWSRMQYVPNLKGVCIIQAYNRPAYFVRTA